MSDDRLPSGPPPRPVISVSRPTSNGDTVTVASKLTHGLILRVFDMEEVDEARRDGTIARIKKARLIPELQFTVRGTWVASAGQAYHKNNPAVAELLPGGYALTPGCPREVWDRWYEQNKTSAYVVNKVIFAHASQSTVQEESKGLRAVQSGLEPLDRSAPGARMPGGGAARGVPGGVGEMEYGEGTTPR